MGRPKVAALRAIAIVQGWLAPDAALPDDATIAATIGEARRARSTISTVEPHRAQVERWAAQGVGCVAIHAALCRDHGYRGSYSSVRRILAAIRASFPPQATVPLIFAPAEAAQVDFGAGPLLLDPDRGAVRRTWCFVMTLCFSRHQYVEFVFDQSVMTWLGCHRRAFEWFARVPGRLIIDNPKCAITRACARDPLVQRAYAECAEGYGFKIDPCPPADPQKKGIVESGVKYVKRNFLPTRTFREPWGLVVNEAMNRGLPVIASDAVGAAAGGLVRDGRNGLVVRAGDPGALAGAIGRLAADVSLRARLGKAAAEDVRAFSHDAWAQGFSAALATVGLARARW